ncbi:MAG TPA: hypothetical protein VLM85_20150 [Polyangiaceae bacterium]|nr:hypothetical protein [Polyangiaceae bacterium]
MRNLLVLGIVGVVCACGGIISGATDGGGDGSVVLPPSGPGQPPAPPQGGGTPAPNDLATFAIQTLFLGESNRTGGALSVYAWKDYGYDLDGLVTTKTSADVCTLAVGAPKANQTDGNDGIDNAWGAVILPIIQTAASLPTPSQVVSQSIQSGANTLELMVSGLSTDPAQSSTGLRLQVFAGGVYPGKPAFDSSTVWPVLASSLADGQTIAGGARTAFHDAYVTNGTFVSGPTAGTLTVSLVFQGAPIALVLHHPIVSFDHTSDAVAENGTIAGVLDPNEFVAMFKAMAGRVSTSLCGSAFDGIAQQILQAQDILSDGTNAPGQVCDGISIGLGFTALRIANPSQVEADPPPPPDPCF